MLALTAAVLLVVPVVALAKSYSLKGTFGNDDNATVSLKVKLSKAKKGKKGKPSKVSGFAVTWSSRTARPCSAPTARSAGGPRGSRRG